MTDTTLIVPDRLHILYNETTGKYVMIGKHILPVLDPTIPPARHDKKKSDDYIVII